MKDANTKYLRQYEAEQVSEELEREKYHKRLAATVEEIRKNEGDFLMALQRAVENIDDGTLKSLHSGHLDASPIRDAGTGFTLRLLIYHEFDRMAKEIIGGE